MDLLEFQGKDLFRSAGLPVPAGRPCRSAEEAVAAAEELGLPVAVKAQVRTGGRGKAGGVRVCDTPAAVAAAAVEILALRIREKPVEAVLVEQAVDVAAELYVAFVLSREHRGPLLLVSPKGGVDVEELARTRPQALLRIPVDPLLGIADYQVRDALAHLSDAGEEGDAGAEVGAGGAAGLDDAVLLQLGEVLRGLWRSYRENDATLVEVNPLVVTGDGGVVCLDGKVTVDDNALWRRPALAALAPPDDERERRARKAGLTYITLDGDIGVIGNGAGLVMSVLDQLAAAGGRAANFCDIGGGASAAAMATAVELLASAGVRVLVINVFGGITRCDEVARGIVQALGGSRSSAAAGAGPLPAVVRLQGTAAVEGQAVLADAALPALRVAADVDELVRLACEVPGLSSGSLPNADKAG